MNWQRLTSIAIFIAGTALVLWAVWGTRPPDTIPQTSSSIRAVVDAAIQQTQVTTGYDPSYVRIPYPGGDVPASTGVCSDVVIRAFRAAGVDLQVKVHEDMKRHFAAYPHQWGLTKPDTSIDHRRVPNLMVFFKRRGKEVPITRKASDYYPGDVVVWDFGSGKVHTGLVSNRRDRESGRFMIVHNAGMGTRLEDRLFEWPVIGHYRYFH